MDQRFVVADRRFGNLQDRRTVDQISAMVPDHQQSGNRVEICQCPSNGCLAQRDIREETSDAAAVIEQFGIVMSVARAAERRVEENRESRERERQRSDVPHGESSTQGLKERHPAPG